MFLAGTNFTLSYYALHFKLGKVFKNEEFRYYVEFILLYTVLIAGVLMYSHDFPLEKSFRDSLFQVVSIITTTGYVTADYLLWLPFITVMIFSLMFFGGSAGSTGGSIKIMRVTLLLKNSYQG
ncbi:MAG: potassium transporter TrkG [Bacteroidales bacterium]